MRQSDRSMMNISELNDYLLEIQNFNPNGNIYADYGNKLFKRSEYIIGAHAGNALNSLTDQEVLENHIMNSVYFTIEHAFSVLCNCWQILGHFEELEMGQEHPHEIEMIVIAYLLSKCSVMLQGS